MNRLLNQRADRISKISEVADWGVSAHIFNHFNAVWGSFSCDPIADNLNRKCKKFYSKYGCPGSSGVNSLLFDWSRDNCWVVPPTDLIGETIHHMRLCRAHGALVVPKWESAYFWPLLCNENGFFQPFVREHHEFGDPLSFFEQGGSERTKCFKSGMMVLRVDFRL